MRSLTPISGHPRRACRSVLLWRDRYGQRQCYGLESINSAIKSKATGEKFNQGVFVKSVDGQLQIELHISVSYGEVNITAIVDKVINKVRYTVEEATDLKVNTVNVYVDALN